ncbi:MAG: hypothetical protein POH28_16600 [Acidocella sp.]|nr:hypothetical protein [Acidocella sp.]
MLLNSSSHSKPPTGQARPGPFILAGILLPFSLFNLLSAIEWGLHFHWIAGPINGQTMPPWSMSDFPMFWTAGHFASGPAPGHAYIPNLLLHWEHDHVGGFRHDDPFVYPPPSLALTLLI